MSEIKVGDHWRHKKRGGVYEIVHTRADVWISSYPEIETLFEGEVWVAYKPIDGHALYFRLYGEFADGRFEKVKDAND